MKTTNKETGEIQETGMVLAGNARADMTFRSELEPHNMAEIFKLSEALATTGICGVKSATDMVVRALTGRDLGLSFMQSMNNVFVVHGRPSLSARMMHALCLQSPLCEEFRCVKTDTTIASYRVKRRGEEAEEISFTIDQAKAAGLLDRGDNAAAKAADAWQAWRAEKLRARAITTAARMKFPEAINGMYSTEELREEPSLSRENELVGEVVAPVVNAASRDFVAEATSIKADVDALTFGSNGKPVRERIERWDGPADMKATLEAAYNTKKAELKKGKPVPATPPSQPGDGEQERLPGQD